MSEYPYYPDNFDAYDPAAFEHDLAMPGHTADYQICPMCGASDILCFTITAKEDNLNPHTATPQWMCPECMNADVDEV